MEETGGTGRSTVGARQKMQTPGHCAASRWTGKEEKKKGGERQRETKGELCCVSLRVVGLCLNGSLGKLLQNFREIWRDVNLFTNV